MTSTADTTEHPDVDEISDLSEGLLSASRTQDIRRHLGACPLCADAHASVQEIRDALGTLPGPPHMPDDVARRIDAALAAEVLLDHAQLDTDVSRETWTGTAAGTAAAETARTGLGRSAGHAPAAAGPRRKLRTRRRAAVSAGAVLAIAAIGAATFLTQGSNDSPVAKTPPSANHATSTFAEDSLDGKVSELLDAKDSSFNTLDSGTSSSRVPSNAPRQKRAVAVPACIQLGTHRNEDPLAAEEGMYEGRAAFLVVLPHKTDPAHRVTAFIVDSSCVGQSSATSSAGKLLYTHSYDRR